MRGPRGFQMHLGQVHGHRISLGDVPALCKFRDVPIKEVWEIEERVKRGGVTHVKLFTSQGPKSPGPGGWLSPPNAGGRMGVMKEGPMGAYDAEVPAQSDGSNEPEFDNAAAFPAPSPATRTSSINTSVGPGQDVDLAGRPTTGELSIARRPSMEL